jgi:hypothetical protein
MFLNVGAASRASSTSSVVTDTNASGSTQLLGESSTIRLFRYFECARVGSTQFVPPLRCGA